MATEVTVPMVGRIVNVLCKAGDRVAEDDQIATLEAMKMEMPIVAPTSGVITKIFVSPGQEVDAETVLAIIE